MSYVARISFNNNQWQSPSGRVGKSSSTSAFEGDYGFGLEEWLFCNRNQFKDENGNMFQYGYLQGLSKGRIDLDTSEAIDLWTLFFQNTVARNHRYFVITINNWQEVSFVENRQIINGNSSLIDSMENDLRLCLNIEERERAIAEFNRARNGEHEGHRQLQLFNIKFPLQDLELNFSTDDMFIDPNNLIYQLNRNSFYLYQNKNIRPWNF